MAKEEIHHEDQPLLPALANSPRRTLVTVEPLTFLYGAGLGSLSTIQSLYIEDRLAQDRNFTLRKDDTVNGTCASMNANDTDYITQQEIAAEMATWTMVNIAVSFLPVVLVAPFYGVLSDRLGRKLNFAIPILAHIVFCIILLFVFYFRLPLLVIVFANLVLGLGGNYCFFLAGCYAYISDISTEKARLVRIAVLQSTYFLSVGSIQVAVGYIIDVYGFFAPVWISVAFTLAALLYVVTPCILTETVNLTDDRNDLTVRELLRQLYDLFANNKQKRTNRLVFILVIYFFTDIIQLSTGATGIYLVYGLGPPFCWSSITAGHFMIIFLGTSAFGLLIGSKLFSLCLEDYWILQIAYLCGGLSNLVLALTPTTTVFFIAVVFGCLRGMDGPVLYSIFSKLASPQQQGTIFAIESSVQSVANFLSPLILNPIYTATVKTHPNTVIYVIASVFFILTILSGIWILYSKRVITEDTCATDVKLSDDNNILIPEKSVVK